MSEILFLLEESPKGEKHMQKRMCQREGNRRVRVNFRANSYPVKIATLPPILVWVRNRLRLALGGLVALIPIFLVSQRWLASCCCTPCSLGQALVHLANPLFTWTRSAVQGPSQGEPAAETSQQRQRASPSVLQGDSKWSKPATSQANHPHPRERVDDDQ